MTERPPGEAPKRPPNPEPEALACEPSLKRPLVAALVVSGVVTVLSYALPPDYAATGVGLAFLISAYWLAVRGQSDQAVRSRGLALGGTLESQPLDPARLLRDTGRAVGWALGWALICFPPFVIGWLWWWKPSGSFTWAALPSLQNEVLGQLVVIALPEEAFFRGYLQSELDRRWPPRLKLLGAYVGPGLLLSSALFALGHVLTDLRPDRLAVFFPSLLFGWLRARTGGIGAGVVFHALCNLFAAYVAQSYGLGR